MNSMAIWEKYYIHSFIFTLWLFLFYLLWVNNSFLYTSILDYKNITSDTFDGTIYPIEFVPNPIELTYTERQRTYSQIDSQSFIKTPIYNPQIFGKDLEGLLSGSKEYFETISQRLIFTVPYLWNYNFDYKEFAWSHPGVDIMSPEWTPIKNIAAGVVIDTGYQSGWFWNYVLIKHNWVPLPNGNIWNIYSLYAHMSQVIIEVGTKIKKAEIIWYVGKTGTAVVPHLHFQIDIETAPYSPYWPFNSNDMKLAHVWFFDGVNIWLGKENAILYTINPLKFVNEYLTKNTENQTIIQDEIIYLNENKTESWIITSEEINIPISIQEVKIDEVKKDEINIDTKPIETINPEIIKNDEIASIILWNEVKKEEIVHQEVELLSSLNADSILSSHLDLSLENISKTPEISTEIGENISQNQEIWIWEMENIVSQSWILSEEKKWTQTLFSDIWDDYIFINELQYFKEKNIISWFHDGSFRPKNNITRIEALKIILWTHNIPPIKNQSSKFADIKTNSWENTYLNAAIEKKIIALKNKKFAPFRSVSRVEGLKIILTLAGVNLSNEETDMNINDIKKTDWFYKYIQYAIKNNLLEIKNNNFYPNKPLSREELVSILYKFIKK